MKYEQFVASNRFPFENDSQICLPVSYGTGKLFYAFPKGKSEKIRLYALEKDSNIYRLDYMPNPLPKGEHNEGFLDFYDEVIRIEKEINKFIAETTELSAEIVSEAKRKAGGFIYRLNNNRGTSKPHRYLTLKAIRALNLPVKVLTEAAVEIFLERESIQSLAEKYRGANKFSSDFKLNIALHKLYSDAIADLGLSEKEQMIADALHDKKDVTVKFDINGKRATGHYTVEQMMAAFVEGFPPPAPKGLSWGNIVEIYSGKKELCVYKDTSTIEEEREER